MNAVPQETPTLFGAHITNISTSIGWGGQGGSCQLGLAEDPDTINEYTGFPYTIGVPNSDHDPDLPEDPDNPKTFPGFPELGTAVAVKYGEFFFGGIFQRYTYKDSLGGRLYDVVLESPAKLLDGVQIILDEYQGTAFSEETRFVPHLGQKVTYEDSIYNVWNPFGELENYSVDGDPPDGNFGNADVNSVGMPVSILLPQLQIFGDGEGVFGGKLHFGESEYFVDFSELIDAVSEVAPHVRVGGPIVTLNSLISDLCEMIQHDYFVDVTGEFPDIPNPNYNPDFPEDPDTNPKTLPGVEGILPDPTLRIRMCDKRSQPQPNVIQSLVDEAKETGTLISSNIGKEQQTATTQRLVVGGDATRWYEAPIANSPSAISVWGSLGSSNNNFYTLGNSVMIDYGEQSVKTGDQGYIGNTSLNAPGAYITIPYPAQGTPPRYPLPNSNSGGYIAQQFELRMALGGRASWEAFKICQTVAGLEPNGFVDYSNPLRDPIITPPWIGTGRYNQAILSMLANNLTDNMDLMLTGFYQGYVARHHDWNQWAEDIFEAVKQAAQTYYGRVFMVPLPTEPGGIDNNFRYITEDADGETSWEISDTAWNPNFPVHDVSFYDGTGKMKSAGTWPNLPYGIYGGLGTEWGIVKANGNIASTTTTVENDLRWPGLVGYSEDGEELFDLRKAYAIVKAPAVYTSDRFTTLGGGGLTVLTKLFFPDINNGNGVPSYQVSNYIGGMDVTCHVHPAMVLPESIGVPQKSNRYKWGPYYAYSQKKGKAEVVFDSNLTPETYGSSATLLNVFKSVAYTGLAQMAAVESGQVEMAEIPQHNVGERFGARGGDGGSGPYITNVDISIGLDGCKVSYKFNTWTPSFGKLSKYNIDRFANAHKNSWRVAQERAARINKRPIETFGWTEMPDPAGAFVGGHGLPPGAQNFVMNSMFLLLG